MLTITLKKNDERRLIAGHRWIFSNEITDVSDSDSNEAIQPGALALVRASKGRLLGAAHYNPRTLIAARLVADRATADALAKGELAEEELLKTSIQCAVKRRKAVHAGRSCGRLVFSESDDLPGLIVDKYGDVLCAQILTAGMARHRDLIFQTLMKTMNVRAIYEKSSGPYLSQEGIEARDDWAVGSVSLPLAIPATANAATGGDPAMEIDFRNAQKTGAFLDQHDNRCWLAELLTHEAYGESSGDSVDDATAPKARLLDLFCYHGHWGICAANALRANRIAWSILGVDRSETAVEASRHDAKLNDVGDRCRFETTDAFEFLENSAANDEKFRVVVSDPPAFSKSRKTAGVAVKAYEKLNLLASKIIEPGGLLVACSCSHHVGPDVFEQLLVRAVRKAGRRAVVVRTGAQASDHPILLGMRETQYLKMIALRFID